MAELRDLSQPHRRYNPLLDEWVLVSPHRTKRPWLGQTEKLAPVQAPSHDPNCYLCPRNPRAEGVANPDYAGVYVFDNDFPALLPETPPMSFDDGLLCARSVRGASRVICFSPDHAQHLGTMPLESVERVVDAWADETARLSQTYEWVQIFENRGAAMGASNPHPHGQIWCMSQTPTLGLKKSATQQAYFQNKGQAMLNDYALQEIADGERVVHLTEHWVSLVPFWATWPFELMTLPRAVVASIPELQKPQRADLAAHLAELVRTYDRVFETPFPYSMGWSQRPFDGADAPHWTLHAHWMPPLLRSASVRKFMVGFELMAEAQRDLTPEQAAQRLREAKG